eukprot:CAMPEP_0171097220 /NCGR_PEP_ID=MMETSP0766_2-20121228/47313_1 /TAXON_ID=439317 /ORGANISM="Gambierdiscus australes, Strain CAWD 149" /LENGTH=42 /DNA_ID= /DNA_START= /DNA_END= /DNA_ORIENTATION=
MSPRMQDAAVSPPTPCESAMLDCCKDNAIANRQAMAPSTTNR